MACSKYGVPLCLVLSMHANIDLHNAVRNLVLHLDSDITTSPQNLTELLKIKSSYDTLDIFFTSHCCLRKCRQDSEIY